MGLAILLGGCRTPDGPHYPIPDQALSTPAPEGLTRVVLINTNYQDEGAVSGPIRIRLGEKQLPSVWQERYVQAFVKPGEYDLHLEQASGFSWKRTIPITVTSDELLISVFTTRLSFFPSFEILDELPSDFYDAFTPGRHPDSW